MPRFLVQVQEMKTQNMIVIAANYNDAKEYALNQSNVRALSYPAQTKVAIVLTQLPQCKSRFDELDEEQGVENSVPSIK